MNTCGFCGAKTSGNFCSVECEREYNEEAAVRLPVDDWPGENLVDTFDEPPEFDVAGGL